MATASPKPCSVFQSTPDLVNRENDTLPRKQRLKFEFQSTPDLVNRENFCFSRPKRIASPFQSTPDLVNRENSRRANYYLRPRESFNPLPI